MIGTINIKVSASRPNMPLGPFHVFAGSAASFTIVDIPLPLGVRKVTGVTLSAKNVAGITTGYAAVRVGSAWGVTVPPSKFVASGSVVRGIAIMATGVDDAGAAVTPWKLGAGDVFIMEPDGSVAPGETVHDLHWHDSRPANPVGGDVAPYEGKVYYFNGTTWIAFATGQGDISHSEFADLSTLQPGDSLGIVKERVNMVIGKLKGTVAAVATLLCLESFAALCPTNVLDDVSGTNTLAEIVAAGGGGSGGGAVASVNGKTGTVVIAASDVGAYGTVNNAGNGNVPVFGSNGTLSDSGINYQRLYYRPSAYNSGRLMKRAWNGDLAESDISEDDVFTVQKGIEISGDSSWPHIKMTQGDNVYPFSMLGIFDLYFLDADGVPTQYSANQIVHGSHTFTFPDWSGQLALQSEITNVVPNHRTVNNKPLRTDITLTASDVGAVPTSRKINGQPLTGDITIQAGVTSVNSKTGAVVLSAADVGAVSTESLEPVANDAHQAYIYSRANNLYMTGNTNAWFAGTNYVFGADATNRTHFAWEQGMDAATVPCSFALFEFRDGAKQCVWDQRDWTVWYWNFKAAQMQAQFAASNAEIRAEIASTNNHAWARHYAASGRVNPDPTTTYVDTKKVCLSPGMNWETVAEVGGCGYWTIVGNGAVIGGSGTNAVLEIRDFEGNSIMTVTKGEHSLAWLSSSDFIGQMTDANGWVCFDMMADVQPVGYFSTSLDAEDFVAETDPGCPAQYLWESLGSGRWRVHFLLKSGIVSSACFAMFQVEVQGQTQIQYNAGMAITGGLIYNGKKIAPDVPANASVGDVIQWKVVQ